MLQRSLLVLFVFFLYGVGNADVLTQPNPSVVAPQTQETIASSKLKARKEEIVSSEVTKPAAIDAYTMASEAKPPVATSDALQIKTNDVKLLPHRATYSITLDRNYDDEEDIADAKGQMTIQLAKVGEGWAIEQKSTLHIYYKDGSAEQVITTLATYESMDGLKYSFNARTLRADQEETISGDAILANKGGAGIVTYQQPDESTIQLPVGTIFPTQHLIYMLQAAMKGQKVVSNIVFDGSSETHEPVQVDTVLGASQDPKLALTNKDLLQAKKVWPMRMAIYAVDSNGPEADYEITQHVLDDGVIRDMTLDYGTFKVKAVLNQVEVFS